MTFVSELNCQYPDYPNCVTCRGHATLIIPNHSNIFPRCTEILLKPCPECHVRAIADVQQQLAAVANDPNLTIVTHHNFEYPYNPCFMGWVRTKNKNG